MAISLVLVNGDKDGALDGETALATVTGATGTVTFTAHRCPPALASGAGSPQDVDATPVEGEEGVYELALPDLWLWWVTVDDGATSASAPVWISSSNLVMEEELAVHLLQVLVHNKAAIEDRMAEVVPGSLIRQIGYGLAEEVEVVPAIEFVKTQTGSEWYYTEFGRLYRPSFTILCYSHRHDDPTSDQELLGQMAGAVRDMLLLYENWTLPSGLHYSNGIAGDIDYAETLGPENRLVGMAQLPWSCEIAYAIPAAKTD